MNTTTATATTTEEIYRTWTHRRTHRVIAHLNWWNDWFSGIVYNNAKHSKQCTELVFGPTFSEVSHGFKTLNQFIEFVNLYTQNKFAYTFKKKDYYFDELPPQMKANLRYFINRAL